nr:hypothetical protein [Enterococcus durans]
MVLIITLVDHWLDD